MTVESLKKEARRYEQREEWARALDLYLQAIEEQETSQDEPDIALHNRVGDLQIRLGDREGAFGSYERAISLYFAAGLPNNAVAVCRKIIRHEPDHPASYLRLGQIRANQGFIVDARQNFLTYAEMMQAKGETEEAFRALEEFAGLAPNDIDTRLFIAEQLASKEPSAALQHLSDAYRAAGREEDADRQAEILERIHAIDPDYPVSSAAEPTSEGQAFDSSSEDDEEDLEVTSFGQLPLDEDASAPATGGLSKPEESDFGVQAVGANMATEDEEGEASTFGLEGLEETTLGSDEEGFVGGAGLEGFEATGLGEAEVDEEIEELPADLDEALQGGLGSLEEETSLESGEEEAELEEAEDFGFLDVGELGIDTEAPSELEPEMGSGLEELVEEGEDEGLPLIRYDLEDEATVGAEEDEAEIEAWGGGEEAADVSAFEEDREETELTAWDEAQGATELAAQEDEQEEEALAGWEPSYGDDEQDRESGEEALEPIAVAEEEADPLISLKETVKRDPSDADGWRRLGDEHFSRGEDAEAWQAMERAHRTYAENGNPERAMNVVRELLVRDPLRIDLRQRVVEYAHQTKERTLLVQAFLDLADGLRAQEEWQKANAVFEQVLEIDPGNLRANEALRPAANGESAAIEVSGTELEAVEASPTEEPQEVEVSEEPQEVEAAPASGGEYVDLGEMVLESQAGGTTRWKVEVEEPTGDEEADFARMLSQFKQKVAENIPGEDARSHYDLGAAYKEMGLLQEAIGEFQQALRAEPRNLAAFEMLGQCFLEQGEPGVAIRTLERALELPAPVEDDLLGMYYWLGQAHEAVGNRDSAREFYEKIFTLDINFRDVTERLKALR